MTKLPSVTGRELCLIIEKAGFIYQRTTGSHLIYQHLDGRKTTIPCHAREEIGPGLLIKIIKKDLKMTREEFIKLI